MKTYILKRYVVEYYEVKAENRASAILCDVDDPSVIKIIKETLVEVKGDQIGESE